MLFEARRDGPEVLDLVKEAFDEVAIAVEEGAEARDALAVRHRLDVRPSATIGDAGAEPVGVVSAVCEEYIAFADRIEQAGGAPPVMGLAGRQSERDRPTFGVNDRMDLSGQAAPRAPHASGVRLTSRGGLGRAPLFWPLAACWWTLIEELSIICRSPS